MAEWPSDLEIAKAICCGEFCRSDTTHCHATDHFGEAHRVRRLLDRHGTKARAAPHPEHQKGCRHGERGG